MKIDYTPQEAYDAIVGHFSRPGAHLGKSGGRPMYRTPEGHSCAVGCLIPDEQYERGMDDPDYRPDEFRTAYYGVNDQIQMGYLSVSNDDTRRFLLKAQSAHDTSEDVSEFLVTLRGVSTLFDIETA